jgi:peptidoglycan/xylan/chitin deacetylase (PgdA/CDA1 family)
MTHPDLTSINRQQQQFEIIESRKFLETKLGVPVLTFAYPFGESDAAVINLTYSAGYIAGMGLGSTPNQRTSNLFALQRRGVDGSRDLNSFASFLPWQGDAVYLAMDSVANLPSP